MTTELDRRTDEISLAGNVGFWAVVMTTVVLLIHPFGTTELYDDGQQFLEHVDVLWVTIHFVVALLFMVLLLPINVWARKLSTTTARTWGHLATLVAIAGTAVGLFHLTATDTTTSSRTVRAQRGRASIRPPSAARRRRSVAGPPRSAGGRS